MNIFAFNAAVFNPAPSVAAPAIGPPAHPLIVAPQLHWSQIEE